MTIADDGGTWGERQLIYRATGSGNNAGAPQVANVGGTLVVTFMTDEDTGKLEWFKGVATMMVTPTEVNADEIAWGNKVTVGEVESRWGGVLTLDSSTVLVMYDHGGCKCQKVLLSRRG